MSRYNVIGGCHTPELTAATLVRLRLEFPTLEFFDESWHNDATDKLEVRGTKSPHEVCVWIPDGEEYPDHLITERDDNGYDVSTEGYSTIEEVINALRKLI